MTEEKINEIHIVPAVYVGLREDGNVLLRCLQGEETVDRAFEPRMFKKIENPKYILLGIKTGVGTMTLNITDGSEFENIFHEKWSVLLK